MDEGKLVRVNSRLGYTQNAWLDEESSRTGISKSGLIQMAVENYIAQKSTLNGFGTMQLLVERLENIEVELKIQNQSGD